MPAVGDPKEKAAWLIDRAYELVLDRFGPELESDLVHKPDVFIRFDLHSKRLTYGLLLEERRLSTAGRRVVFAVSGPTANSCRVRFRKRLQGVEA